MKTEMATMQLFLDSKHDKVSYFYIIKTRQFILQSHERKIFTEAEHESNGKKTLRKNTN